MKRKRTSYLSQRHKWLIARRRDAAEPRPEWGCFAHNPDNRYPRAAAVKVYTSRKLAEDYCRRAGNLVARQLRN